jgi:hypothetical protein
MAKLDQISRDLRRLEQVAPRKVRNDVATVANFAQRFSHELREVSEARSGGDFRGQYRTYDGDRASAITVTGPDGIRDGQPWQTEQNQWYSNPVFIAFQNVSRSYPGALSATSDFVSYAQDRCGEDAVPQGYQPDSGNGPGGFMDGGGMYQPMPRNPVVVQPQPQPGTQPAATTTTTTVPASTPAPPSP